MEYFKRLPEEITIDILTRVPTESIVECKLVSKSWRNLLRQPSFSQLHFRRLSNPDSDSEFLEVYIYTLGSRNGWRNLGKFSTEYNPYPLHQGMFSNGVIYWLSRTLEMIVTFDLAEEKFCEHLSPPPLPVDYNWDESRIGVLDGFLWFGIGVEDEFYDIWQLKRKNDNHDMKGKEEHQSLGWSKKCRVDESQLLADTKSDCVLTCIDNYLNIYDPKALTLKRLVDFKEQLCQVYPHKNTLISLKELGEEDTKIMKAVEIKGTESRD